MRRPHQLLTTQTIARDQNEVATKLAELLSRCGAEEESSTLVNTDVKSFGVNQFLVLVTYYGNQIVSTGFGLLASVGVAITRGARKVSVGLSSGVTIGMSRGLSATGGLTCSIVDDSFTKRKLVSTGLVCRCTGEKNP